MFLCFDCLLCCEHGRLCEKLGAMQHKPAQSSAALSSHLVWRTRVAAPQNRKHMKRHDRANASLSQHGVTQRSHPTWRGEQMTASFCDAPLRNAMSKRACVGPYSDWLWPLRAHLAQNSTHEMRAHNSLLPLQRCLHLVELLHRLLNVSREFGSLS